MKNAPDQTTCTSLAPGSLRCTQPHKDPLKDTLQQDNVWVAATHLDRHASRAGTWYFSTRNRHKLNVTGQIFGKKNHSRSIISTKFKLQLASYCFNWKKSKTSQPKSHFFPCQFTLAQAIAENKALQSLEAPRR